MKGNGFVKLRISGHGLDLKDITEKLAQEPDFQYYEGESFIPKYGDKKPVIYKEDCWIVGAEKKNNEPFEDMVEKFLLKFQSFAPYLQELSKKSDITLLISIYPDEGQCNVHLSDAIVKLASDMGVAIDFEALFLKEFYDGTYTN